MGGFGDMGGFGGMGGMGGGIGGGIGGMQQQMMQAMASNPAMIEQVRSKALYLAGCGAGSGTTARGTCNIRQLFG